MIHLRTLGALSLRGPDGQELDSVLRRPKYLALLTYLAVARPPGFRRRDTLVSLFWPELDQVHARNALRQAVHYLRQALGDGVILARGEEELGVDEHRLWCDALEFERALDRDESDVALELYRGDLLNGLHVSEALEFERWLDQERQRIRRRAADAASELAAAEEASGNVVGAVQWARRAVEIWPHEEALVRRLIELLDRAGDRAGALREYREFQRRLAADLDVEPSPETNALVEEIRARAEPIGDVSSGSRAPAETTRTTVNDARRSEARLHTAAIPPGRPGVRWVIPLTALGVLFAVAAVWIAWRLSSATSNARGLEAHINPATTTATATRIAVFPFRVQGGVDLDYLSEGVMDALSEAMDGLGELRRVQPLALMSRLRREGGADTVDPQQAARIAHELGARRYILGSVVDLGTQLSLSASVYDVAARSEPLAEASVQGEPEQLAGLVIQLTRRLVADIPVGEGARLERVGTIEPANFEAFKAYLQGEALLRRGSYDSAAAKLRDAVEADSTFAVAWYRLGLVLGLTQSMGLEGDNYATLSRAARYRQDLSRRDRLLVDAWLAHFHGRPEIAERLAREVVGAYPDDVEAWHLLGITRMWYIWQRGRRFSEPRAALERALTIDSSYPYALYHAYALAIIEGRHAEAERLTRLAPKGVAEGPWAVANRGLLIFLLGDRGDRAAFTRGLSHRDDQTLLTVAWILANHSDSLATAERVLTELADDPERSDWGRSQGQIFLGHLEAARGRWRDARAEFMQGVALNQDLGLSSYAWLAAIPFFDRPSAELASLRDSLETWQVSPPELNDGRLRPQVVPDVLALPAELRPWMRDYLLGLLNARLRDRAAAEEHALRLEQATEPPDTVLLRHDLALEIRALAAFETGRPDVALGLLEKAAMTVAHADQGWYPRYYTRPFARFLRAESLRLLGRDEEALGWYAAFGEKYGTEYVYRAPVFLRLAEIYERRGDRQRALEYYRRFVARWREADPEYQPLVREIEARVQRLTRDGAS